MQRRSSTSAASHFSLTEAQTHIRTTCPANAPWRAAPAEPVGRPLALTLTVGFAGVQRARADVDSESGYGGLIVAVGALALSGTAQTGGADLGALRWHVAVWDVWFLLWGSCSARRPWPIGGGRGQSHNCAGP
jgi:hypothetical protein